MPFVFFAIVLLPDSTAEAVFHLVQIDEVMAGANGDANIQFVEMRMCCFSQNTQGNNAKLVFFTAARRGPTPEPGQPGILLTARFRQKASGEIPQPAVRVETLELTSADFEFIRKVDLAIE